MKNGMSNEKNCSLKRLLSQKIILSFMLPLSIGMLVVVAITFYNVSAEKKSELERCNALLVENVAERVDKFSSQVELHARNQAITSLNPDLAEPYLQSFIREEGEIWSHFLITDASGMNIAHSDGASARGVSIADRSYFSVPWEQGITEVAAPTFSKSTGRRILAIGVPIERNGVRVGVLVGFVRLEYISQTLGQYLVTPNSFNFMINANGAVSAHPNDEIVLVQNWLKPAPEDTASLTYISSMSKGFQAVLAEMAAGKTGMTSAPVDGKSSLLCYRPLGVAGLSVATVAPASESYFVLFILLISLGMVSLLTILLNVYASSKIADGLTRPILGVTRWAQQLALGNTSGTKEQFVSTSVKETEIRMLIESFEEMSQGVQSSVEVLQQVAGGNLDVAAVLRSESDILSHALNRLTNQVSDTLSEINLAVHEVSSGAEMVANSAQSLAGGAIDQSGSVERLSIAIGSMQQQFVLTSKSLSQITCDTSQAEQGLQRTNSQMQELMEEIHQATAKSQQISKIIKAIEDIAFQTNILALNASVEAARAGAAGKGFAVVADEVRNLAGKSAEAAQSTAHLIESTVSSIALVAQSAEVMVGTIEDINATTVKVASDVREISKTIEEEVLLVQEIAGSVEQISSVVQTNSATSEESAAASEELSGQAERMKDLVAQFRLKESSTL